jgi:LmbE family N-acetylglucosaminyl deacetylase
MKILAVGAHADDVELGCGGMLRKAVNAGHKATILVMTQDGYSNYDGTVLRTERETCVEANDAALVLGADLKLLKFVTTYIPCDGSSVGEINEVINSIEPDWILTHSPFDTHQDHATTAQATIAAARKHENIFFYEPFPPSGRSYVAFKPQVYMDISDTLDAKIEAITCHKSQVRKYGEEWTDSVRARAKLRGYECNVRYAETFELLRLRLGV